MYVYSSDISRIIIPPHEFQQVLPAVYLPLVFHQEFQYLKLFGCQVDFFSQQIREFSNVPIVMLTAKGEFGCQVDFFTVNIDSSAVTNMSSVPSM